MGNGKNGLSDSIHYSFSIAQLHSCHRQKTEVYNKGYIGNVWSISGTKKPTSKGGRLSNPTIHYTTKARRAIVELAESILCFCWSSNSRVLAAKSVS